MNKAIRLRILITTFIFLISNVALGTVENKLILPRLDFDRIEVKQQYYNLLVNRGKRFRKVVYTAGATAAVASLAYLSFKVWEKLHEDNGKSLATVSGNASRSVTKDFVSDLFSSKQIRKLNKTFLHDVTMQERCKIGLLDGISDGFYYGAIGVVASSFLAVQTKLFDTVVDQFTKRWRIKDHDLFCEVSSNLNVHLSQLRTLFQDEAKFYDKEELKENYKVFIYAIENFMALILAHTAQSFTPDQAEYQMISNLQNLLSQKVIGFSDELEVELNSSTNNNFENGISAHIFNSFKALNNQIIRFVNHCRAAIYEV